MPHTDSIPDDLAQLAAAHGVATRYLDGRRQPVLVAPEVVIRVLSLLEVEAETPDQRRRELVAAQERSTATDTPRTIAVRSGEGSRPIPGLRRLSPLDSPAETPGSIEVRDELPTDLAPGWYRGTVSDPRGNQVEHTVVVAPARLPVAPSTWGWMVQAYALHSARSWGIGDLGDITEFVAWTAREHGAGAVLLNPMHAPGPTHPVQPSPYTPSSRRFANPLALRIEDIPAYHRADPATRSEIDALRVAPPGSAASARLDHDLVWAAKRSALELLWRSETAAGRVGPEPPPSDGLIDFATWCSLAERHGGRWSRWPEELRNPRSAAVTAARGELAPRIAFHIWVQHRCAEQLATLRDTAKSAGMRLGVVHDLAVGVDPEGADAWALSDVLASGVTVGAPPDDFTPLGQNWGLPPWRPDRLAATGYAAFRDMLRAVLAHADGLRIDHVAGLWRLWWVPPGADPNQGTYVHYDADTMLAVLALEAHRAGAVVVGEDLGTVEPEVTEALAEQEMLGCAVAWFTRDDSADGTPLLPPQGWPERAAASLSTHDLPTAAGFLRGEHISTRADLGLIDDIPAEEANWERERADWLTLLREQELLPPASPTGPDTVTEREIILALHRLLARTPCRLKLVSPYDVLAEPRQPNLPGTVDEYPNWRLPLPVTLDQLYVDPRVTEVMAAFREATEHHR
jgi:4-alpha-glucanotransferase